MALNEIAQNRLDAQDIGEPEAIVGVEEAITDPTQAIDEYAHHLAQARPRISPRADTG